LFLSTDVSASFDLTNFVWYVWGEYRQTKTYREVEEKLKQMADIPDKQIKRLRALIAEAETALAATKELLISLVGEDAVMTDKVKDKALGKVIEGVFDGQNMVGSDAKTYPVPANYASKSKLVQGDILKLTIADDGAFMYKQIGPIPRRQVVGVLNQKDGHYFVDVDGKQYRVLLASVTYFKAKPGDQVSVNVPEDQTVDAEWAALEAAL
jgi:hypothetical protein